MPATTRGGSTSATPPALARAAVAGEARSVLVVEDERAVRALARKALERSGFQVLEAESGTDALEILNDLDRPIDLLLTDMVMPSMGGKELATRAVRIRSGLPVLFMSGYSKDFLSQQGEVRSEHMVLEKPFTPKRLVEAVADVLTVKQARD